MQDFVKLVIQSSFEEDKLLIPKQAELKIEVQNEVGEILVRFQEDNFLINVENCVKEIRHKVVFIILLHLK